MTPPEARARFAGARVARLATVGADGVPHLVPIVFAVDGDVIYSAVDHKPKRTTALRRLANVAAHPAVSLLADHYEDDDWERLWWVRADGTGMVIDAQTPAAERAAALIQVRYGQYADRPPAGPVLAVTVERWSGWAAADA
jgi:PPOX class probable F420-dependent enzyme